MSFVHYTIEPIDIHLYSRFNFSQAELLYKAGYDGAMLKMPELKAMVKSLQESVEKPYPTMDYLSYPSHCIWKRPSSFYRQ